MVADKFAWNQPTPLKSELRDGQGNDFVTKSPEGEEPLPQGGGALRDMPRQAVRESLGIPLAAYLTLIIVLATLAPFRLGWEPRFFNPLDTKQFTSILILRDIVGNILVFIPIGFIFRLCLDRNQKSWSSIFWAALLSISVELLQMFFPPRVTSVVDVATNILGAVIGRFAFDCVDWLLRWRGIQGLTLELPLAGVFYLLIPVFGLNSRLTQQEPDRVWLALCLGIVGGIVVATIAHHRLVPSRPWTWLHVLVFVALWFIVSMSPAFFYSPRPSIVRCLIVLGTTLGVVYLAQKIRGPAYGKSRRFEEKCLRRVLPVYLLYLLGSALSPWQPLALPWHWRRWFDHLTPLYDLVPLDGVFLLVEAGTSFTLFGFMIAGLRGRVRETRLSMFVAVTCYCGLVVATLEVLRGFHPLHHASIAHAGLTMGAALLGAYLYRMHQRTVWRILGRIAED